MSSGVTGSGIATLARPATGSAALASATIGLAATGSAAAGLAPGSLRGPSSQDRANASHGESPAVWPGTRLGRLTAFRGGGAGAGETGVPIDALAADVPPAEIGAP